MRSVPHKDPKGNLLLNLVDNNDRAVNRTVCVVAPLELLIVLSIKFITTTLLWSSI